MNRTAARILVAASAASLLVSSPAAAAAKSQATAAYSPWAILAATHSEGSAQALCGAAGSASAAAAAGAAAQATPGCVLPAVDAPVAVPAPQASPILPAGTGVTATSLSVLPLLLGLAVLGGVAALLLANGGDSADINLGQQPISP